MADRVKHITLVLFLAVAVVSSLSVFGYKALKETPARVKHFAQWYNQAYGH